MSKYILFIAVVIFFTSLFVVLFKPQGIENIKKNTKPETEATNMKTINAKFLVFTKGLKRDFSSERYHNLNKEVYIDSSEPSIVNVKSEGVTWGDFFDSLPMKLTKDCLTTGTNQTFCTNENEKLVFYLNGVKDDFLLDSIIYDGDEALVSFGIESDEEIQKELAEF